MNNSVINAPIYFKLLDCGKIFLNKIDAMCERACMENQKEKYDTELINYQRLSTEKSK